MENYNQQYGYGAQPTITLTHSVSKVMRSVYMRMFLGLLVTAGVAIYVAATPAIMSAIFSSSLTFWGLIIAEFACVIAITGAINKLSTFAATSLFFLYAVLNGVVFSSIFWAFELGSIAYTFAITAGVFGAMSIYGYLTSNDLTKMGSFLFMALIGLIITTIVNIFVGSSTLEWLISFAGVAIFIGLTAWDTQKIKQTPQIQQLCLQKLRIRRGYLLVKLLQQRQQFIRRSGRGKCLAGKETAQRCKRICLTLHCWRQLQRTFHAVFLHNIRL